MPVRYLAKASGLVLESVGDPGEPPEPFNILFGAPFGDLAIIPNLFHHERAYYCSTYMNHNRLLRLKASRSLDSSLVGLSRLAQLTGRSFARLQPIPVAPVGF